MTPKDDTNTSSVQGAGSGAASSVQTPSEPKKVGVKILKHHAEIGGFNYALGSLQELPEDKAAKAVELGLAEYVVL